MLMITVLLGAMFGISACSKDKATTTFPVPIPEVSRKWLFDVYGTAANDVYIVGNLGAMFHFDGTSWTRQNMGTTAAITTVWASPIDGTRYAVGHKGHIWRNTGTGWT